MRCFSRRLNCFPVMSIGNVRRFSGHTDKFPQSGELPQATMHASPMTIISKPEFVLGETDPHVNVMPFGNFVNLKMGKGDTSPRVNFSDLEHEEYRALGDAAFFVQAESFAKGALAPSGFGGTANCIEGGSGNGHAYFSSAYHTLIKYFRREGNFSIECNPEQADFVTNKIKILAGTNMFCEVRVIEHDRVRDVALLESVTPVNRTLPYVKLVPWTKDVPPRFVFCCGYRIKTGQAEDLRDGLRKNDEENVISVDELDERFGAHTGDLSVSCFSKNYVNDVKSTGRVPHWMNKKDLVGYRMIERYGEETEEIEFYNSGLPGYSGGGLSVNSGEVCAVMTEDVKLVGNYAAPILADDSVFGRFVSL